MSTDTVDLMIPLVGPPPGVHSGAFVLVHPAGGGITPYLAVAEHLSGRGAVTAIRAAGLLPGESPDDTVAAMADRYLPALLAQPPAVLFGWSLGGLVAHELAVRLAEHGHRPAVVMVDSSLDIPAIDTVDLPAARRQIAESGGQALTGPDADPVHATIDAHLRAVFGYRPSGTHPCPTLLFSAGQPAEQRLGDWSAVAPNLRTHLLRGEHFDVFAQDNLAAVLARVDEFLAEVLPADES